MATIGLTYTMHYFHDRNTWGVFRRGRFIAEFPTSHEARAFITAQLLKEKKSC